MKSIIITICIIILSISAAYAGDYQPGGEFNHCISSFYDRDHYNWYSFKNNCYESVHIVFTSQGVVGGAIDVKPGRKGSIGHSRDEVNRAGGVTAAICRDGYLPVDANNQYWRGGQYKCKRQ